MPSLFIEPFDFKTLFINFFLGNQILFPFAFIILMSFACAKFGMSNQIFLSILAIGAIMFGAYLGQALYVLALFLTGFVIYRIFVRVLQ